MLGMVLSLAACKDASQEKVQLDPAISKGWHEEPANLVGMLNGAVVLDRSGEMDFEHSTIYAFDGDAITSWLCPPGNIEQWMLVELPGLSRVEKVGLATGGFMAINPSRVKEMRIEFSEDGETFDDAGTLSFKQQEGPQFLDVTPRLARFVRFTVLSNYGNELFVGIPTLLLQGERIEAPIEISAEGHWKLNNLEAFFKQQRNRVYGYVAMDPPMLIDGAWDGSVVRFSWVRGRSYGTGIFSINPEMTALNGLWWYEHLVDEANGFGAPWFGSKIGRNTEEFRLDTSRIAQLHIERDGTYPLFGLVYDDAGAFDASRSLDAIDFIRTAIDTFADFNVRLLVREYSQRDSRDNLAMSQAKAASLHDGLVAAGLPSERLVIDATGSERLVTSRDSPIHWKVYTRVDFALTGSSE